MKWIKKHENACLMKEWKQFSKLKVTEFSLGIFTFMFSLHSHCSSHADRWANTTQLQKQTHLHNPAYPVEIWLAYSPSSPIELLERPALTKGRNYNID